MTPINVAYESFDLTRLSLILNILILSSNSNFRINFNDWLFSDYLVYLLYFETADTYVWMFRRYVVLHDFRWCDNHMRSCIGVDFSRQLNKIA